MALPPNFVEWLECPAPRTIVKRLLDKSQPTGAVIFTIHNELRPVDLYCYLYSRFGPPNGVQNFLRSDDSDNLIHWEWVVAYDDIWLIIQGLNFRTLIIVAGNSQLVQDDRLDLIQSLKADFKNHGTRMSDTRSKLLEHWIEFVNPYFRIKSAFDQLLSELTELHLEPSADDIPNVEDTEYSNQFIEQWKEATTRYSRGLGLCFGIRSMLPVMAESFINLLLFNLMRSDLKKDTRLRENILRQPIDIRIKSLHLNCRDFSGPVDYAHEVCRRYHTLVNDRNDLLHGNVVVDKLKFNEVYFNGRVPVFNDYRSMWQRSIGVDIQAVGLEKLMSDVKTVEELIEYVLGCLTPVAKRGMQLLMSKRDLGQRVDNGTLGILFPSHLVDSILGPPRPDNEATGAAEK